MRSKRPLVPQASHVPDSALVCGILTVVDVTERMVGISMLRSRHPLQGDIFFLSRIESACACASLFLFECLAAKAPVHECTNGRHYVTNGSLGASKAGYFLVRGNRDGTCLGNYLL